MVQVGAGQWQHVPLGDLHDDRYLPLHPQLVELIGECRTRHVHPDNHLLLPRENGEHDSCSTRTIQCERFEVGRRAGIAGSGPQSPDVVLTCLDLRGPMTGSLFGRPRPGEVP